MCQPASFVLTKDSVFWSPTSDSHEDIIKEFGLYADGARGPNICRVEHVPSDGLYWTDPATWAMKVDQDCLPEWWDAADAERRVKAVALNWQAAKIIKPDQKRDVIKDGEFVLFNYGTVQAIWGGTVQAINGGTVQAYTHVDPALLKSKYAVLIDRSGDVPVCYVGKDVA